MLAVCDRYQPRRMPRICQLNCTDRHEGLESRGRERWLPPEELQAFERKCDRGWRPFFAALLFTGPALEGFKACWEPMF